MREGIRQRAPAQTSKWLEALPLRLPPPSLNSGDVLLRSRAEVRAASSQEKPRQRGHSRGVELRRFGTHTRHTVDAGHHMPAPLAFTDEQIAAGRRSSRLSSRRLAGKPLGDGQVFRAIREVQGRYLDAPKWDVR